MATEQDVTSALEAFKAEAVKATGSDGQRARFGGFRIADGVKDLIAKAIEAFKEANFDGAIGKIREASTWLHNAQRKYCANSVGDPIQEDANPEMIRRFFFDRLMDDIPALDEDLETSLRKKYRAFVEIARLVGSSPNADLEEASVRYWALLEAITAVPAEQVARERNRALKAAEEEKEAKRLVAVARRKAQEARDEESRVAQAKANELRRVDREKVAASLADQLASIFG